MTALDHAALRALADAATPGPWALSADGPPPDIIAGMSVVACTLPSDRTRDEDTANAAYIAAAHPAAVLALLDENARMREALHLAEQFIVNGCDLGFIRMPDRGDPALHTLPAIRAALGRPGA